MQTGGAELRTLEVMRALDRSRFALEFCALTGKAGDLDPEVERLGGRVHHVGLGPSFPARFVRLLRRGRFDAVHSHVHLSSGAILALARMARVPRRIAHFRSASDGRPDGPRRRAQRLLMRSLIHASATNILAVSRGAMSGAWGDGWESDPRCEVIYNGIDEARFAALPDRNGVRREFGIPPDSALCIHVGRMDAAKNHEFLVEAFARLAELVPKARLVLVGRGGNEIEHRVRARAAAPDLRNKVFFAGVREDVPRLLLAADVMLFPSLWEGLPGALLEGCAAGLPVVASDIPPVREVAPFFRTVRGVPLSEGCLAFARIAAQTLEDRSAGPSAPPRLAGTPFALESCVARLSRVWTPP
jgi:glycosyltransferase involved in cell wall biosynthesis